jgi:hypothetical protein
MYEKNSVDHKTNTEIAKELNITPVLDKIQHCKRNCIQHVNPVPRKRLLRLIKNTPRKAEGTKEDHGRDFWIRESGTGQKVSQLLDCYVTMMMMMMMMKLKKKKRKYKPRKSG